MHSSNQFTQGYKVYWVISPLPFLICVSEGCLGDILWHCVRLNLSVPGQPGIKGVRGSSPPGPSGFPGHKGDKGKAGLPGVCISIVKFWL